MGAVHPRTLLAGLKDAPTFRSVPRTEVVTSPEALRMVLSKLGEAGCQESLEWLLSALEDVPEDWDPEESDDLSLVIDEDREASATNERIPKNKLKHREATQALPQNKRACQDDSFDRDADEVGSAGRGQRKRKRPRARDTRESEGGGGGGRTPLHLPTTAEPIKKRKRATLVVDSDKERKSSKSAELADVDSEEDPGPLVIADDGTAYGTGMAAKGGRLVVLDDSNDEDVVVNASGAVADRGVANGDAGLNDASGNVIDLHDGSELSDSKRSRSSESPTRSDSLGGSRLISRESRKESSTVVEDGGSGCDAEIIEDTGQ
ncbi:hypothetical protein MTO96_011519 [Rhipicephalus appendiculatus]